MKLSVLALDYDGTITRDDRPDEAVLSAIAAARRRDVIVMIVTGRILDDLRRAAGGLRFVDVVVAENGAVVHFPGTGHTTVLAPRIPQALLTRLEDLHVRFRAGECLVDADASSAHRILDLIRELELPIVLSFNRSRVMALAQGVSKATGLAAALNMLRASPRNTVAVGDAENDHEMLRFAEVGAAVAWGSRSLQAAADLVIAGHDAAAVGDFIRSVATSGRVPVPVRARRRLLIGHTEDGREFSLAVRGRNVLIIGETNSGKSWLAGLLCERLILHGYSLCVIDPEGDYRTLGAMPGVTVLGGGRPSAPSTRASARAALSGPQRGPRSVVSHTRREARVHRLGPAGVERHTAPHRYTAPDRRR